MVNLNWEEKIKMIKTKKKSYLIDIFACITSSRRLFHSMFICQRMIVKFVIKERISEISYTNEHDRACCTSKRLHRHEQFVRLAMANGYKGQTRYCVTIKSVLKFNRLHYLNCKCEHKIWAEFYFHGWRIEECEASHFVMSFVEVMFFFMGKVVQFKWPQFMTRDFFFLHLIGRSFFSVVPVIRAVYWIAECIVFAAQFFGNEKPS